MKPRQLTLFARPQTEHGGSVRKGRRKIARFIAVKSPMHLVLRASQARGERSFLHRRDKGRIHLILVDTAERFGVKIHAYANVGNHIHLAVQVRHRKHLQAFMRVFAQRVMFQVTGACKGNPQGRFFESIAYTRAVKWGHEFATLKRYIWKNTMEALGFDRSGLRLWKTIPT